MNNGKELNLSLEGYDSIDAYFECITACSLGDEGVECVTECVATYLKGEKEGELY